MSPPRYPDTARRHRPLFTAAMNFPASCFVVALVTDILYVKTYNMAWETFSVWLLTIGLLAAAVFFLIGLAQGLVQGVWPSMVARIGYALALILSIFNAFVHSRDGYTSVMPTGLTLSVVVTILVVATWIVDRNADARTGAVA